MEKDIKILDCTLRDGGYINNWKWGRSRAELIVSKLTDSGIDIIEVGFLKNADVHTPNNTISNSIADLNSIVPGSENIVFAAMAMISDYDVTQLDDYEGHGIELIRVTAHSYDIDSIFGYADIIQKKGYKVSVNPINIMGYSDAEILNIIDRVNIINPYQFTIVDTFGSMNRNRLKKIVGLVDDNLNTSIRLGLHLHENMALSYCMAQDLLDMNLSRPITIDASLMGMGRTPGNLPIELLADYMNTYWGKKYDLNYILDALYDYIYPYRGEIKWGYTPEYFLSAKYNLHRNYAEFFLNKGDLTTKDINYLLARIEKDKASVYDKQYAEELYYVYNNNLIDDHDDRNKFKEKLSHREVLIVSPGESINHYKCEINDFIAKHLPIVIALNFEPEDIPCDYVFFTNRKRYVNAKNKYMKILTSNIKKDNETAFYFDYNSLSGAFKQGCNSFIMLLKLLKGIDTQGISVAGADGYKGGLEYYESSMISYIKHDNSFNVDVSNAVMLLGMDIKYLTPTEYGESEWK